MSSVRITAARGAPVQSQAAPEAPRADARGGSDAFATALGAATEPAAAPSGTPDGRGDGGGDRRAAAGGVPIGPGPVPGAATGSTGASGASGATCTTGATGATGAGMAMQTAAAPAVSGAGLAAPLAGAVAADAPAALPSQGLRPQSEPGARPTDAGPALAAALLWAPSPLPAPAPTGDAQPAAAAPAVVATPAPPTPAAATAAPLPAAAAAPFWSELVAGFDPAPADTSGDDPTASPAAAPAPAAPPAGTAAPTPAAAAGPPAALFALAGGTAPPPVETVAPVAGDPAPGRDLAAPPPPPGGIGAAAAAFAPPAPAADSGGATAPAPAAAAPGFDAAEVARQASDQLVRLVASSGREVTVQLHPPELGDLTVRVAVAGRDVSAWFGSPQPLVQQAIGAALGQLQAGLGSAGYTLSHAWVGADASGAGERGRNPAPPQRPRGVSAVAASGAAGAMPGRANAAGVSIYV